MRAWITIVGIVVLVAAAGAGWYFVSPLFITEEVNEELPFDREDVLRRDMEFAATAPDVVVEDQMPEEKTVAEPTVLSSGQFADADSFHQGSGTATVYDWSDGTRLLRLEDFEVTNGPDLIVVLSKHPAPSDRDQLGEDYVDLGDLKGNKGNQNYEISPEIDLTQFKSVVIYCRPFHVVFSTATIGG